MVSIPDWSRFRGMAPDTSSRDLTANKNAKYNKQREEKAIKEAEESGYFTDITRKYLEDRFLAKESENKPVAETKRSFLDYFDKKELNLGVINLIKLETTKLRTVGDIGICRNLTICILSNNFIVKIDGLAECVNLVKLDLHSNQISMLPAASFWADLLHLTLLSLHDNPIGRIENLHYLAGAPNLTALTLYDTPLSLKKNYRHHVVNSVWSLKALDNFVISDEEIIEDADFGGKFCTLHPSFYIDLNLSLPQDSTFEEEFEVILETLADINHILAHNSPVLIIQRYMRGYLLRKRLNIAYTKKSWASEQIQRKFRSYKLKDGRAQEPPPPSPIILQKPPSIQGRAQPDSVRDTVKLDYDTYMQNRRPGSTPFSDGSVTDRSAKFLEQREGTETDIQPNSYHPGTPIESANLGSAGLRRKNIFINLAKLHAGTLQSLQDETIAFDMAMPSERSYYSQDMRERPRKKKQGEKKRKVVKSVKQFFGPVVDTVPTPEDELMDPAGEDEVVPLVNFRLRGMKQRVKFYDPTTDMILAKRDAGKDIRDAEDDYHLKAEVASQPKPPKLEKKDSLTSEQRIFARVQGTMGLSCLHAVQQAYKDREKAEKRSNKLEYVMRLKEQKEYARRRTRLYHEEKRNKTLKEREREHKKLIDTLEKLELTTMNTVEKYHERRNKSSQYQKHKKGELTFIGDFNVQNTSVSNALLRHDRQARNEDKLNERNDVVQCQREQEHEQQEVVAKYLEHRKLMRQTETAMARAALDTKMLQEANDRLIESRSRVAQQKALSAQINHLSTKVSTHSMPPMSPEKVQGMRGLDRWNTTVYVNRGHVGRHPTSVTM